MMIWALIGLMLVSGAVVFASDIFLSPTVEDVVKVRHDPRKLIAISRRMIWIGYGHMALGCIIGAISLYIGIDALLANNGVGLLNLLVGFLNAPTFIKNVEIVKSQKHVIAQMRWVIEQERKPE